MKISNNFLLLPQEKLNIENILLAAGKNNEESKQTIKTTGISKVSYAGEQSFTDFTLSGLKNINKKYPDVFEETDVVIVVSQSYDQRIPSISTRIQKTFNLDAQTFCIDIMDGCSGYIKALRIASLLSNQGAKKVMIVAGDLNSTITGQSEVGTKILFGDGISVSLLECSKERLDAKIFNDGDTKNIISCDAKENTMLMHGFEVFRFTRNVVPDLVKDYLEQQKSKIDDYDLIALHQASNLVVSTIARMIKSSNTIIDDFACGEIGNLGAGSIGAWLSQGKNITSMGDLKMLAVGYGSGLSWGIASVVVNLEKNEVVYV